MHVRSAVRESRSRDVRALRAACSKASSHSYLDGINAVALGFFGLGFLALLHPCLEGVLRAKYQGTEAHAEAENAMGAQSLKAVFG